MSSTLCFRKTPKPTKQEVHFKQPIKGIFARKFYDHDGSLGGDLITIGDESHAWLQGVYDAGVGDEKGRADLKRLLEIIEGGDTVDMWLEC